MISNIGMILTYGVLFVLLAVSSYTDLKERKIYNKFTFPCIIIGLLLGAIIDYRHILPSRFIGLGVGFGLFFILAGLLVTDFNKNYSKLKGQSIYFLSGIIGFSKPFPSVVILSFLIPRTFNLSATTSALSLDNS